MAVDAPAGVRSVLALAVASKELPRRSKSECKARTDVVTANQTTGELTMSIITVFENPAAAVEDFRKCLRSVPHFIQTTSRCLNAEKSSSRLLGLISTRPNNHPALSLQQLQRLGNKQNCEVFSCETVNAR